MALHCPNCRNRVPFLRAFRTPAWSSFPCQACGSVLTISFARRIAAGLLWAVTFVGLMEWGNLARWGRLASYGLGAIFLLAFFYFFEKLTIVDRRAFTCRECGYDLQGLPESRCPECGTEFDPSEIAQIRARIGLPEPQPKRRVTVVLVVVGLAFAVAGGFVLWSNSTRVPTPTTTTSTAPAN